MTIIFTNHLSRLLTELKLLNEPSKLVGRVGEVEHHEEVHPNLMIRRIMIIDHDDGEDDHVGGGGDNGEDEDDKLGHDHQHDYDAGDDADAISDGKFTTMMTTILTQKLLLMEMILSFGFTRAE